MAYREKEWRGETPIRSIGGGGEGVKARRKRHGEHGWAAGTVNRARREYKENT